MISARHTTNIQSFKKWPLILSEKRMDKVSVVDALRFKHIKSTVIPLSYTVSFVFVFFVIDLCKFPCSYPFPFPLTFPIYPPSLNYLPLYPINSPNLTVFFLLLKIGVNFFPLEIQMISCHIMWGTDITRPHTLTHTQRMGPKLKKTDSDFYFYSTQVFFEFAILMLN